jgi:hypothetical protein
MLGKLIKHEFKAVSKILGIFHIALFINTIMGVIAISLNKNEKWEYISNLTLILYILILIAVGVAVLIYIVVRFYRNLFTDEGYLMNTLPVKSHELILSKLIVGFVWCNINVFCTIISIFILVLSQTSLSSILDVWNELSRSAFVDLGLDIGNLVLLAVFGSIVSVFYMLIMFYAAIAIGHTFGKHKVLFSLGAYVVLYILSQIVSTIVLIPFGFVSLVYTDTPDLAFYLSPMMYISYAASFGLIIVYFIITNHILNKKLNLE